MTRINLNTIVKYFCSACLMLSFASCSDDFFNVEVGERITENEHFQDKLDVENSFKGTLISLQDVAANSILVDGLRSDQMVLTSNANADLWEIGTLNTRADNPLIDKSAYYQTIINVNEVLAHIQEAADRDREFLDGEVSDMRATLHGLKSWCYLTVMRNYGEVNYMADNLEELPDDLVGGQLSKDQLLDSLINTFYADSIIFDLFESKFSRVENVYTSFPNYKAVLGELYLEKGEYDSAVYYLKLGMETIPSGQSAGTCYKVASYDEFGWEDIFYNAEDKLEENICAIPYNQAEGQPNTAVQYFLPDYLYMVKPAQHLIDSFDAAIPLGQTAIQYDIFRGVGVTYDTTDAGEYYINKYSISKTDPYSSDVILQRAAEVSLLLAEALNRSGRSDVAMMLLNSGIFGQDPSERPADFSFWNSNLGVRGRVRLTPRVIDSTLLGTDRIEMIEDFIIEEKAMECAFEGKRMSDLIRVAERRNNPEEYISSVLSRKHTDPVEQEAVRLFYLNRENWYLPN